MPAHVRSSAPAGNPSLAIRRWWRKACAILTILLALVVVQTASARDLGTWCATIGPGFHLVSDLKRDAQSVLLGRLARIGPVAEPFLPGTPVARPSSLKIVVFSRRGDFRALTGKRKFAAFMQPSIETNRLLVGPIRDDLTQTTLHEYAHYLVRNRLDVSLPLWFDEGLASVIGRAAFDETTVTLGELPVARLRTRLDDATSVTPPLTELSRTLTTSSVEDLPQVRIDAFYDWSWLITHYLYFETLHGQPISGTDLERYLTERPGSLLDHLDVNPSAFLRVLTRYLRSPPPAVSRASPPAGGDGATFECLSDFQRDHELAKAVLVQHPEGALKLIEPYLEEHRSNVDLLVTRGRIALADDDPVTAERLAEAALALDPGSAGASIFKADVLVWDCLFESGEHCRARWQEARPLYQQGVRSDPGRFDGVLGLGLAYLYTARPGEAVNYIRVAYARAPWAALVNYYLGESYRLIGDTRARGYLVNAERWAVLPAWRLLAEESLRRLDATAAAGSDVE